MGWLILQVAERDPGECSCFGAALHGRRSIGGTEHLSRVDNAGGLQLAETQGTLPNLQYIVQPGGNDDRSNALVPGPHMFIQP